MVYKLTIYIAVGSTFIDLQIVTILPEQQQVTFCDSNPVAKIRHENKHSNAVLNTKNTGNMTFKTFYESGNCFEKALKLPTIVRFAK